MRYPIAPMRQVAYLLNKTLMHEGGFEPPKRVAIDLKSIPFDQTREPMPNRNDNDNDKILFLTGLLKVINLLLRQGSNL